MPSSYTDSLRLELQDSGENETTWGDKLNDNFERVEDAIAGSTVITMVDANYTLSENSGAIDESRFAILVFQGVLTAPREVVAPQVSKVYIIDNRCNHPLTIKTSSSSSTGVSVQAGTTSVVYSADGISYRSASSPTSDGSITPSKIDPAVAQAWRLGGAVGIGRSMTYTTGLGWLGIDGDTGSRTTYYVGGAAKGEINANALAFNISSAADTPLEFGVGGTVRIRISSNGDTAVSGNMSVGGVFNGTTANYSSNVSVGGTLTVVGGINGMKPANVSGALGYTPVQQGTGPNQNANSTIKIGYSTAATNKIRLAVDNVDFGNLMFEGTTGVFTPVVGAGAFAWASNSAGVGYTTNPQIREPNFAGSQGGSTSYEPGLTFHWGGVTVGQIRLQSNAVIKFSSQDGNSRVPIYAGTGYFTGDVIAFYSDMRLKTKIGRIDNAMAILRKLEGFRYVENDLAREFGYGTDHVQLGVSAQDVVAAGLGEELTALAPFDAEPIPFTKNKWKSRTGDNYLTVNYERFAPVFIEALKEKDAEIATLKTQMAAMQKSLTTVMNRVSTLEGYRDSGTSYGGTL